MENGARDERGDRFGAYAGDSIRDDEIGVMFKRHGFSLNYNYTTKSYEQKELGLRGKFISSPTMKLPTITDESEASPTEIKRPRIATDTVIQQDLQPGSSRFK